MIEVLIGLLIMGAGTVALSRLQSGLWTQVDHSRDRARALRLAQTDLEQARTFVALAPTATEGGAAPAPWESIAGAAADHPGRLGEGPIRLTREVRPAGHAGLKAVAAATAWQDRRGQVQGLRLATLVDATDPRWSVWMSLDPGLAPPPGPALTHLPAQTQDLGQGEAAWRPWPNAAAVWLFDTASSAVTRRCEVPTERPAGLLRPADLLRCAAASGLLLAGTVRFATHQSLLGARDAENPLGPALPLALRLDPADAATPAPGWDCSTDAPEALPVQPRSAAPAGAQTLVRYACLVQPDTLGRWSGRLDLLPLGWTLASTAADPDPMAFRVCRYSADHDGNGLIDNLEHPAVYRGVERALTDQHFLLIQALASCPVESAAERLWANDSTVAHQP